MSEPIDPELLNAVASIIAILTGLELGETRRLRRSLSSHFASSPPAPASGH